MLKQIKETVDAGYGLTPDEARFLMRFCEALVADLAPHGAGCPAAVTFMFGCDCGRNHALARAEQRALSS